jgi:signal transduction histidine kinase
LGGRCPDRNWSRALHFAAAQSLFKYQSGRVIALGRTMLAALFLLAIWIDGSQPAQAPTETYAVLTVYVLFAALLTVATWRNWWLDARTAGPAHAIDIGLFTFVVLSTNGYTSPFFLFFVFLLLSAAIRWGWRETALTAVALILLYLTAGLLFVGNQNFELQRFIVRTSHLLILSAILIWFGVHAHFARVAFQLEDFGASLESGDDPLEVALRVAMAATGAQSGVLAMAARGGKGHYAGPRIAANDADTVNLKRPLVKDRAFAQSALLDLAKDRALTKTAQRHNRFARASAVVNSAEVAKLDLSQALVAEVHSGTGRGFLVLDSVPALSSDYVELGRELARASAALIDRHALLRAVETGAIAKVHLSLARDLHDSVSQLLAGTSMRLEAMRKAALAGRPVAEDIGVLQDQLDGEQKELREVIGRLRHSGDQEPPRPLTDHIGKLLSRTAQQWGVECELKTCPQSVTAAPELEHELTQLLRESIANAVRHGSASRVSVAVSLSNGSLSLVIKDNGRGFPMKPVKGVSRQPQPWSVNQRVHELGGTLMLASSDVGSELTIMLPWGRSQ